MNEAVRTQEEAFDAYMRKDFGEAETLFAKVGQMLGEDDKASTVLLDRSAELKVKGVPADWDGSEVLLDKTFDDARDTGADGANGEPVHTKMKRKVSLSVGSGVPQLPKLEPL